MNRWIGCAGIWTGAGLRTAAQRRVNGARRAGDAASSRRAGARAILGTSQRTRAVDDRSRRDPDPQLRQVAAGNYESGYGFFPLVGYLDETREALGAMLRPGNAGAITAVDHLVVLELALEQIPREHFQTIEDPRPRRHRRRPMA